MSGLYRRRVIAKNGGSHVRDLQWRIAQVEEQLRVAEFKLSHAVSYDDAKRRRIALLESELADWQKLRDPDHLAEQMLAGVPAQWTLPHAERFLVSMQIRAEPPDGQ